MPCTWLKQATNRQARSLTHFARVWGLFFCFNLNNQADRVVCKQCHSEGSPACGFRRSQARQPDMGCCECVWFIFFECLCSAPSHLLACSPTHSPGPSLSPFSLYAATACSLMSCSRCSFLRLAGRGARSALCPCQRASALALQRLQRESAPCTSVRVGGGGGGGVLFCGL